MASLLDVLKQIPSQLAASVPKVGLATGLAGSRLGIDALQGLSGLYDLVTPGTGTNRVTKGLNNTARNIDQTAQNNGVNPAYRIMQAALTPAAFYAPGAAVSKLSKGADILDKTVPILDNGRAVNRIANAGLQGLKPLNAINAAVGTAGTLGQMSGQGQDINPVNGSLVAALNLAAPLALPASGQATLEAPGAARNLYNKGVMAQTSRNALKGNISQLDNEIAGWQRQIKTLAPGDARSWDLIQRKIDRNQAIKQQLLSKR